MCTSRPAARRSNKATADPPPKPMSLPGHGRRPSAADLLPPLSHGTPAVVAASAAPPLSERAGLLRGASASSIKGLEERQPFSSAQLVPPIGQQASFSGNALEILDELRSGRGDGGFEVSARELQDTVPMVPQLTARFPRAQALQLRSPHRLVPASYCAVRSCSFSHQRPTVACTSETGEARSWFPV